MSEEFFGNLSLISSFAVILPLLIALWKYNRLHKMQLKLVYLLITILVVESISNILWYQKINNLPIYHFYSIIEFVLIVNIYKDELRKIFPKRFFYILIAVFAVFSIVNMSYFQKLETFNSNATTLLGILMIFLSLSYFYALLKEVKYSALEQNPMFWLNAGFLIYFSSNLILFFINNSIFKDPTAEANEVSYLLWGMHAVVNIVLILFYTISIWVNPKQP
ncbi:hypothetical protein IMCC3317_37190 [Kordia antarctica]|uniref:Histidine kinase N-terminal 7TM region domain-containing protein n=1 Tax=Kordia antarctica TaxID=1218801 RepID=A0A7L4ZNL6_9FLAO|nr:hypothetical protein [Kordia antarctica]QHI38328.1 hypothetical protein IMCC3317_37190 [Kordia antarctica]